MMKRIAPLLLFFFLLSVLPGFSQENTWAKRTSVSGSKRERGIAFSIGTRGYVGLGQDTLNLMCNDIWEYDPGTNSWTQKANFPGPARRDAACFTIGTKGYVGTGINNADAVAGTPLLDFWEYNPATNMWTPKANYPGGWGAGVYYTTGFAVSGKGYFCCGKLGPSSYSNELWEFNPATNTWTQKAFYPNGVRYGGVAFVIGNVAYFGTGTDENVFTSDFCKYDPATNTWTPITAFPGSGRFACAGFTLNGNGYVLFGSDGGYKDELWEYIPGDNYWYAKSSFPGGARRSGVAFTINNKAYAGTGKGLSGTRRDWWEYTPALPVGIDESNSIVSSFYPNPVTEQSSVVLSSEMMSDYDALQWQVTDAIGRILRTEKIESCSFEFKKDELTPGVYFFNILSSSERIATKRILVL
jgi:N-acetylneuraminic acid mutarotase